MVIPDGHQSPQQFTITFALKDSTFFNKNPKVYKGTYFWVFHPSYNPARGSDVPRLQEAWPLTDNPSPDDGPICNKDWTSKELRKVTVRSTVLTVLMKCIHKWRCPQWLKVCYKTIMSQIFTMIYIHKGYNFNFLIVFFFFCCNHNNLLYIIKGLPVRVPFHMEYVICL